MKVIRKMAIVSVVLLICFFYADKAFADTKVMKLSKDLQLGLLYPGWAFLIWACGLALQWILLASFPNKTERLTAIYQRSPWKSLIIGLINLFVIVVIVGALSNGAKPLALLIAAIAVITLFVGIHGRSRALGRKILKASGHGVGPLAEITIGWTAVAFLCAIPYLGLTVLLVYFYSGGLGAVTLSFFSSKPAPKGGVDLDSHQL